MNRRIGRRLVASGIAAAAAALALPAAAQAAPAAQAIVFLPNMSVAPGAQSGQEALIFGAGTVHHLALTFDLTGLPAGVSFDTSDPDRCDATADSVTCGVIDEANLDDANYGLEISLSAADDATVGDTGKLKVTVDSDDSEPVSMTADIAVAEGVDLSAGPEIDRSASPGTHLSAPLTVANSSGKTAHGAVLVMFGDEAIEFATKYSNCVYVTHIDEAYCTFDDDLQPDQAYGLTTPLDLKISTDSQAPTIFAVDVSWYTPGDWADEKAALEHLGLPQDGPAGIADRLQLTKIAGSSPDSRSTQTDVNPNDNFSEITVSITGTNEADYRAIGADVTGTAGDTSTVKVGFTNHGPAAIRRGRAGSPTWALAVTFPKGVTVTSVISDCVPTDDGDEDNDNAGKPGFLSYLCNGVDKVGVGDTVLIPFTLKLDKDLSDAKGTVKVSQPTASHVENPWDHHLANNTADIVINPSSDSGSLPVTGTHAFAIGGAGAAAVAIGVLLFWLGRRRRGMA